jgi:hypothetical protein
MRVVSLLEKNKTNWYFVNGSSASTGGDCVTIQSAVDIDQIKCREKL